MEIYESTERRNRPFFSCLAASLSILLGLSVFLASPRVGTAKADPASGDEAFLIVQDSDGKRWTELDGLHVFANKELEGKSVVAPGSEGSYSFTVENTARFPLKYEISFDEENQYGVPLEYRLKGEDGYLTEDWTSATELAGIEEELTNNSEAGYTLEWRWIFNGDTERDTAIGRQAAESGVPYTLKLSYVAKQNGEAVNPPQPGSPDSPQTGDNSNLPLWIALMLCSGTALMLTMLLRRRYDYEEE